MPFGAGIGSTPASHTIVSAPSCAVRRIGRVNRRNVGSDSWTPRVSAQPGCMLWKPTGESGKRRAHCSVSVTWARFARAYARTPS